MLDKIQKEVEKTLEGRDPAHDFYHIIRVYKNAELIGRREGADMAEKILRDYGYSQERIDKICYCIRMHSYSKKLTPSTLEGKILQDADRLDALGAIGIARTFSVGGSENRAFYNPGDPFCKSHREPDDKQWTLDHFQAKLLKLKGLMHTQTAKNIAQQRVDFMVLFIEQLQKEI